MIKNKYSVKRIFRDEYLPWVLKKHYAKRAPSISHAFGLYDNENVLQGICTFGMPASPSLCVGVCGKEYRDMVIELNRLCVEQCDKNMTSYFVGKSLSMLPNSCIVVSYADTGQFHHGYIYQATNFIYTGVTKERTDIGFEDGSHSRHYKKDIDYSKNRKIRTAKHRYVYFTGNKREKREMLKSLKYNIEPYPKGDNKNYDASYQPEIQLRMF